MPPSFEEQALRIFAALVASTKVHVLVHGGDGHTPTRIADLDAWAWIACDAARALQGAIVKSKP